jgi:hypothetical protein
VIVTIDSSVAGGTVLSSQGNLSYTGGSASSNSAAVSVIAPTVTLTPTPILTPTHTPTPVVALGTPVIYPNPVHGDGPVFTTAFRRVNEFSVNQAVGSDVLLPLSDRNGQPLANGLYYVLIQTPDGRSIQKLLVLR